MATKKPAKKNNGLAVIYARYSSHNQKDASIEQQVAECEAHAKELGLKVIEVYADRAISGRTDRRPNFQRMMKASTKGRFQYVLAWKSNRIGRNMLQAMLNEKKLTDNGVRVLYSEEDFDDTAAGRFALRSMMNVNQFYSENMAEDIMRGLMDNAQQAKVNGSLPLGYRNLDGHYAIDKPAAKVVVEIFTRVAAGHALIDIARDLNARGVRTKQGKKFTKNSFNVMLHNERYRGIYIYKDIRQENAIPRIISDDLFFRVQEALKLKKNPRGARRRVTGTYLLTGKLFCGHCRSPMTGASGTSKQGDLHYYYRCQGRKAKVCDKKNVQRDWLEEKVTEAIVQHCLTDEVIEMIADKTLEYNKNRLHAPHVQMMEDELASIKVSLKNLLKAIEAGIFSDTTKNRLDELEARQAELTGRLAEEKSNVITISREDMIAGLNMFKDGDITDKAFQARLFDTFLTSVYLYDDGFKIDFALIGKSTSVSFGEEAEVDGLGGGVRLSVIHLHHEYNGCRRAGPRWIKSHHRWRDSRNIRELFCFKGKNAATGFMWLCG